MNRGGAPSFKSLITVLLVSGAAGETISHASPAYTPAEVELESGKTLDEWAMEWWKWVYSIPMDGHPLFDGSGQQCGIAQEGRRPVFFLVGTTGGSIVRDSCVAPSETALFFPIVNHADFTPSSGCSEVDPDPCASIAEGRLDLTVINCSVDGVPVSDLDRYFVVSPCFDVIAPDDGLLGDTGGELGPGCTVGHYIMLKPPPPGRHVIQFDAVVGDFSNPTFQLDVTYLLRVVPATSFRRGDSNGDGRVELTDAINILNLLFGTGESLPCSDAADAQDDGSVDISDAIYLLSYLFRGGDVPPTPGPEECGPDPTDDRLPNCSALSRC